MGGHEARVYAVHGGGPLTAGSVRAIPSGPPRDPPSGQAVITAVAMAAAISTALTAITPRSTVCDPGKL